MNSQISSSISDRVPEFRLIELADVAVDVITALDYLLSLLQDTSAVPLILEPRPSDENDVSDLIFRRRLDARSAAVRLAMRLSSNLTALEREVSPISGTGTARARREPG
jgi:hypothetical protein